MFDEVNRHCRDAQDQAASAIQALARAFHPERSDGALRNDLSDARERLRTAILSIDAALKIAREPAP